jgi:hypothetical protein
MFSAAINTPKTSIQHVYDNSYNITNFEESNDLMDLNLNLNEELTDDILEGITKRVVFNENRIKVSETLSQLKAFMINEKCHLINENDFNTVDEHNLKFTHFKQNRRSKEEEYNKLLQCLSKF